MNRRLALLCLSVGLVFLTACKGSYVPPPATGPVSRAPAAESLPPEPAAELQLPESEAPVPVLSLDEYNSWRSYDGDPADVDLEALVDEVMGWLEENFNANAETAAAVRAELLADYAALVYAAVDGEVPTEIADRVDALLAAYCQLYTIVTEPSGTVQEFVRMLCSCTYSIAEANADLTASLEIMLLSVSQPEGFPPAFLPHHMWNRRRASLRRPGTRYTTSSGISSAPVTISGTIHRDVRQGTWEYRPHSRTSPAMNTPTAATISAMVNRTLRRPLWSSATSPSTMSPSRTTMGRARRKYQSYPPSSQAMSSR